MKTEEFIEAVKVELEEMKKHGTSYRIKTAELSLRVLMEHQDVNLYRNRQQALQLAREVLIDENEERHQDVAQALNSLLVSIERKLNRDDEMVALVQEKMKNFKMNLVTRKK